jgi:hypothetical protein
MFPQPEHWLLERPACDNRHAWISVLPAHIDPTEKCSWIARLGEKQPDAAFGAP